MGYAFHTPNLLFNSNNLPLMAHWPLNFKFSEYDFLSTSNKPY